MIDTNWTEYDYSQRLRALERGTTTAAALAFFDELPAVPLELLVGAWRGSGLPTGHPLDGLLEAAGWHGKRFDGPDEVHPLVFRTAWGKLVSVNPSFVPLGLVARAPALFKLPAVARPFRAGVALLRTSKPRARLRLTAFRGVTTATMIYDALPINDVFRAVDEQTLLGVMDMRGLRQPFVFVLRREDAR